MTKQIAFTLTEVLITLAIAGVIAAITTPNLVIKYQKQATVNGLRKAYTEMNQAFRMSEIDNGDWENWDKIEDGITPKEFADKYFKPYLKIIKVCNTPHECYKGSNPLRVNKIYGLVLNNGSYVWFREKNSATKIIIDTNGLAKPNTLGHDVFYFSLNQKGMDVASYAGGTFCSETDKERCAGKIIYDGWQIKDDYPWK